MGEARRTGRARLARNSAGLILLAVLPVAILLAAVPAQAHRLNLFAVAEGSEIVGRAYFSGGGVPRDVAVIFHGPGGAVLGEARTDAGGAFRFAARQPVDHRITIDTGDGHVAEFVVHAAELAGTPVAPAPSGSALAAMPAEAGGQVSAAVASAQLAASGAGIEALVETAVARQLRPLREQLAEAEARARMTDVLGGIGFILGITGTAFFFLGRRR